MLRMHLRFETILALVFTTNIMSIKTCAHCGEAIEQGYDVCWKCGTPTDGSATDSSYLADQTSAEVSVPERELACLRCGTKMKLIGKMKFHEGTRLWPALLGEVGELLVNREAFDTYGCPECGKAEFFLAGEL